MKTFSFDGLMWVLFTEKFVEFAVVPERTNLGVSFFAASRRESDNLSSVHHGC